LTVERACEEMGLEIEEIEIRRGQLFPGCALGPAAPGYGATVYVQPAWTTLRITFASDRHIGGRDVYCYYTPDVGANQSLTIPVGNTVIRQFDLSRVRSQFRIWCDAHEHEVVFKPEIRFSETR
jgi:hypothetical protein